MTLVLNIIALILALPLQMASYSKAMAHLREHHSIAHHDTDRHDAHHHHAEDHADSESQSDVEHSHDEGGPVHSHAKEFASTQIQCGMSRSEITVTLRLMSKQTVAQFSENFFKDRITDLLVFRPPIQA